MNSYTLSRQWFDFAFENPDKITVYQVALYMWLIEVNNRGGWAEKFPFNTEDACTAIGVYNRKTVWKALNELEEIGFIQIVYKSSHRHKPSVISLPIVNQETAGSLDKSLIYQSVKRTSTSHVNGQVADQYADTTRTSTSHVNGHSNKPQTTNKETNKPLTLAGSEEPERQHPFLALFNSLTGRKFQKLDTKAGKQYDKLKKQGYGEQDFKLAIENGYEHAAKWDSPGLFTPEYISRESNFTKYLNWKNQGAPIKPAEFDLQAYQANKRMVY